MIFTEEFNIRILFTKFTKNALTNLSCFDVKITVLHQHIRFEMYL